MNRFTDGNQVNTLSRDPSLVFAERDLKMVFVSPFQGRQLLTSDIKIGWARVADVNLLKTRRQSLGDISWATADIVGRQPSPFLFLVIGKNDVNEGL